VRALRRFWRGSLEFGYAGAHRGGCAEYDVVTDTDAMVTRQVNFMKFQRITVNASQMGGVPCIRGLRISVATVVGMVAEGMTFAEILSGYPDLEGEDIQESLRFAAQALQDRELPMVDAARSSWWTTRSLHWSRKPWRVAASWSLWRIEFECVRSRFAVVVRNDA